MRRLQHRADVGVVAVGGVETGPLRSLAGGHGAVRAVGVRDRVWVETLEGGEVIVAEGGDEGLEEGAEVVVGVGAAGDEHGAFVGVEACEDGDAQVFALAPGSNGEVGD